MPDTAQGCIGLALGQVEKEGFGQIQPQHWDFRGGLKGVRRCDNLNDVSASEAFKRQGVGASAK